MAETIRKFAADDGEGAPVFTCISCEAAFQNADAQRVHYRSDHHRYNMKRRVAGLPPVSAVSFNQKVLDRREETAVMLSPKDLSCEVCRKSYTTEGAYNSHMNSKKHKETTARTDSTPPTNEAPPTTDAVAKSKPVVPRPETQPSSDDIEMTIEQKLSAARTRLSPSDCLFCQIKSSSLEENLTHMSTSHGFFVPDADYLVDLTGLITYLGEKIAVGNVCIYCNGRRRQNMQRPSEKLNEDVAGREFKSLEATRKHMVDKGHCKVAYDTEQSQLEISDYYDFTSSYPTARPRPSKLAKKRAKVDAGQWEDVSVDGSDADEVMEESASEEEEDDSEEDDDEAVDGTLRFGDSPYELVLPSGGRIGHRSLQRYYKQSFRSPLVKKVEGEDDPKSGAALVRQLLADKNSALVPRGGGFGAFGQGGEVVKARNPGEAREAGRHVREFRDVQRQEQFKTKVGFIHNSQKHFRDPLLQ